MRHLGLVALLLATGCSTPATGQAAPAAPRVHAVGMSACTLDSHTEGDPSPGAASGCGRTLANDGTLSDAFRLSLCGPCAFTYDDATTRAERARGEEHACCYRGESPPPPPPS